MILKKKMHTFFLFFALICASFQAASADVPVQKEEVPSPPTPAPLPPEFPSVSEGIPQGPLAPSYEGAFVKMIATVIGLVCFVLITIWVLRRIGQGRFRGFGSNRSIQVVERKPLSPKTMLYLVEIGHKKFLIAESQLEVRRLGTIEELSETSDDETT